MICVRPMHILGYKQMWLRLALCLVLLGCSASDAAPPTAEDASATQQVSTTGGVATGGNTSSGGVTETGGSGSATNAETGGMTASQQTGGQSSAQSDASMIMDASTTDAAQEMMSPPLDCGPIGVAIVDAGPPSNRVNYVILADGYTETTINTTLMTHIENAMEERFSPELGQPYLRYKNFVNICLLQTVSETDGIGKGPTIFSCTGDDTSRLASCDTGTAQQELAANIPPDMMVDWHSIVLNNDAWWNTGSSWMLWSGGNMNGPKAALHEGGHGFHQLADEYCASGTGTSCSNASGSSSDTMEYLEVNSTADMTNTAGKWDLWLGDEQVGLAVPNMGATGMQSTFRGSRYVDQGQYRPSGNSKMNSLFGDDLNTSYNAVSREKMVMDIWRYVEPIDSTNPPEGAVSNPATLTAYVIDPEVINVDWSVDGAVISENGGASLNVASLGLSAGSHTISAFAYDNATTDLVRYRSGDCPNGTMPSMGGKDPCFGRQNWPRSQQTVTWDVTIP